MDATSDMSNSVSLTDGSSLLPPSPSSSSFSATTTGRTAPLWHSLPDAVWNMILRDWLPNDRDVVHAAITEKASLSHPVMQSWSCKKQVTLLNIERIWKSQQRRQSETGSNEKPSSSSSCFPSSSSSSLPPPSSSLRVGSRGLVRRAIIGVEGSQEAAEAEVALFPHVANIAPHVREMEIVVSAKTPLDGLVSLPPSLRTLHLMHVHNSRFCGMEISHKDARFDQPLGGILHLPAGLTELDLSNLEWVKEKQPLQGLQLPASLLTLKLPRYRCYSLPHHPPLKLPEGLTTLHMGAWEVDYDGPEFDPKVDPIENEALDKRIAATWPQLPSSLTSLDYGLIFQPVGAIVLPPAVQSLFLTCALGTRMPKHALPRVLPPNLKLLDFNGVDLRAADMNTWLPPSLETLKLYGYLELNSTPWQLPTTITELSLQLYQNYLGVNLQQDPNWVFPQPSQLVPIFKPEMIVFPVTLRKIDGLPPIDHDAVAHTKLPPLLQHLEIRYNIPFHRLTLPLSLEHLILTSFNESLDQVHFPPTLHTLVLGGQGGAFEHSLASWTPPPMLTFLHLGPRWDLPLSQLHVPPTLRRLKLDGFNQPLTAQDQWPCNLEYLEFSSKSFDQCFDQWIPPQNLQHLKLSCFNWSFPLDQQKWPPLLRKLELPPLPFKVFTCMHFTNWPLKLEEWKVDLGEELEYEKRENLTPFSCCDQEHVRNFPASLRRLFIELPPRLTSANHLEVWAHLTRMASFLPSTLKEIIVTSKYKSRENFNAAVPAIRHFCDSLPPTCSFRFSDSYLPVE